LLRHVLICDIKSDARSEEKPKDKKERKMKFLVKKIGGDE
jgi:hypothetical protein